MDKGGKVKGATSLVILNVSVKDPRLYDIDIIFIYKKVMVIKQCRRDALVARPLIIE